MRSSPSRPRCIPSVVILSSILLACNLAAAQARYVRPLINEPVNEGRRTVLKGNIHPLARPQFEVSAAPPDLPMERMLLILKRSPEQETALLRLLDDQQDKSSPDYHKWLTPEQFGQNLGPADSDIQAITSWLQSHGLQVTHVSKGRVVVEFSGTAAQVRETFHTAIRKYLVNGEAHWANASEPEIPAALAPVVAGVHSLHNFYAKPQLAISSEKINARVRPGTIPQVTLSNGTHGLVPADYQTIYKAIPVLSSGINGQGQNIAVVARSNLFNEGEDVSSFREFFGTCCGFLEFFFNGPDPGDLGGREELEATLDATWASAMAPSAEIHFVISAGTNSTDGILLSEIYIIDNNLDSVMTESFGRCEPEMTNAALQGTSALAEQAAAQGITYILSSGDSGAAGCLDSVGTVAVSGLASTPFTLAVGGTQFNENGQNSTYWTSSNGALGLSARSYIPEDVWNESCTSAQCGSKANVSAGGGGASVFFPKPSWQSGVSGIPNDSARDLPDVSLTAAGHDPYLLCWEGSCRPDTEGNIQLLGVSGTSASAPAFAGIMALVNQKTGARQGQANYVLYRLAAGEALSQCNASKTTSLPAAACVFNDVTIGNNAVPGEAGYGTISAKYQSAAGYDLATGLGSVNVTNLVNNWSSVAFRPTTTALTVSPSSFMHGTPVNINIVVAPNSGAGTPTGDVSLIEPGALQGLGFFSLSGGSVSGTSAVLPGNTTLVQAHYAGDATFAASDSSFVNINVSPEPSTVALSISGFDGAGHLIPFTSQAYGTPAYLRADVSGLSGQGTPVGIVFFGDSATNFMSSLYALNSQGTSATAQGLFTIPAGPHAVVAQYTGDFSFNPGTSPAVNISVTKASTATAIVASSNNIVQGGEITLTAEVSTNSAGLMPSGVVTFLAGGAPIANAVNPAVFGSDGSANIQNGAFRAAHGTAVLVTTLPVGQNSVTAQYSGDLNYVGSTSAATHVNVIADFAFEAAGPSMTIASPGGSGTMVLKVTGQPGYNGVINFSAASCDGLPHESTCSFNPVSISGSGSTTVTVSTTAPHTAKLVGPGGWGASFGMTLAGVFFLGTAARRKRSGWLLVSAIAFLITTGGCGGASGGGGNTLDPGTRPGTSTLAVVATAGTNTHVANFSLIVQ